MTSKILLCISGAYATVGFWQDRKLTKCEILANNQSGWINFSDILNAAQNVPVYVMVDVVEEDYRYELLPHVRGKDRDDMVERKLKQLYRNTPYHAAWLQGREKTNRHDDQYLFLALTNPDVVYNWIHIITSRGSPLAGVYLVSMAGTGLLNKLDIKFPNILLVTQDSGGLRQTFFKEQKLRTSRLIPLELSRDGAHTTIYAEEIANTRLYLDALKITNNEETVLVLILDYDDSLIGIEQALANAPATIQFQRVGREHLIKRLNMDPRFLAISNDILHLYALGSYTPPVNLAPSSLVGNYRIYQAKRAVYLSSLTAALVALVWSSANFYQQLQFDNKAVDTSTQTIQEHSKYLEVTRHFPVAPAPAEVLHKTVELAQLIRSHRSTPEPLFELVSTALEANPQVILKTLTWKSGNASLPTANEKPSVIGQQTGSIDGEIKPFKGDYNAAISNINRFAEALRQDNRVASVTIVRLPLDISPSSSLAGSTQETREQQDKAQFKIDLVLK